MKKKYIICLLLVLVPAFLINYGFTFVANSVANSRNIVLEHDEYNVSSRTENLHANLLIGDVHSDVSTWYNNIAGPREGGHVDLQRLEKGNVALQMFTSISKAPINDENIIDDGINADSLSLLAVLRGWPYETYNSAFKRTIYQAEVITKLSETHTQRIKLIKSKKDLSDLLQRRKLGKKLVGALLGSEGAHSLDSNLSNIDALFDVGVRMLGLQHSFDNELGGSLHGGELAPGLSEFGLTVARAAVEKGLILDVSHSSPKTVRDLLNHINTPFVVSHTGFQGFCDSFRNLSDDLLVEIASRGGLIGYSFGIETACEISPEGIVKGIRYGIDLIGVESIALGSNFDGGITTTFDASELKVLTEEMMLAGFSEYEIRRVMGENMIDFFMKNLPD